MLRGIPRTVLALGLGLALAACGAGGSAPPPVKGDQVSPGEVQVAGLAYCDAARLELVMVVLGQPPVGESLETVRDATAPGCTWQAVDGGARVRLNVYPATANVAAEFDRRASLLAHKHGQGQLLEEIGERAAKFGFAPERHTHGVILVEARRQIFEFEARDVPAPKLSIFARSVSDVLEKGDGEG